MAIKTYKPYTPARRGMTVSAFDGVDKKAKPERSLLETLKKNSGRNSYGRITVRHRGGGNKRKYRVIDFRRDKLDMPAVVQRLEYDPNRSAFIALVKYEDGELRYVLAPVGLKAGDTILASAAADIKPGNCLPLANIPVGTIIHNIELQPGYGAQLVRSAGVAAQLLAKEGELAQVRLPSGEVRYVRMNCTACIGQVGNIDHGNVHIGKAGRKRHMGIRPDRPRLRHEPERPPPRRRRRPRTCWPSRPRHSVGQACYGLQDPQDEEPAPTSSSSSAATVSKEEMKHEQKY